MKRFMKKRFGFTLAEVLITLGIIGVVAAMTIPSLIQNTNSTRWTSQYKKTFATLTNAAEMAIAQHDMTFNLYTVACNAAQARTDNLESNTVANRRSSICAFVNATLANVRYINTGANAYVADNGLTGNAPTWGIAAGQAGAPNTAHVYALPDGSWIAVPSGATNTCTVVPGTDPATLGAECHGFIDVNGAAAPNQPVMCNNANIAANNSGLGAAALCNNFRTSDIRDIYPIVFHDGTVSPSSTAARFLLSRAK